MSDNLTKEQRKRQKRKEAQKKKKAAKLKENQCTSQEKDGSSAETIELISEDGCGGAAEQSTEEENFESELCWCIEQLELGIRNKKPSKDEAERATRLMKILKSAKASKVKKRQVMHNTFGDYRKKMAAEVKHNSSNVKPEPKIVAKGSHKVKGSMFLKKKEVPQTSGSAEKAAENKQEMTKWHFQASGNSFQFSFPDPS